MKLALFLMIYYKNYSCSRNTFKTQQCHHMSREGGRGLLQAVSQRVGCRQEQGRRNGRCASWLAGARRATRQGGRYCSRQRSRRAVGGSSPRPENECAAGQRRARLARASLRPPHDVGSVAAPPHWHTRPGPLAALHSAPATGDAGCAPSPGSASTTAGPDRGGRPGGRSEQWSTAGPRDRHTPATRSRPCLGDNTPAAAPNRPCTGRDRRPRRYGLATLGSAAVGPRRVIPCSSWLATSTSALLYAPSTKCSRGANAFALRAWWIGAVHWAS